MKAVVMAGGEGSRLRPLTLGRPKPLIPVVNKPVLTHILELLRRHGITDVVITLQYLADHIKSYYGDGSALGMSIEYSVETVPLGTAGSVKLAQPLLDETFLVISGDALTDFDLTAVVESHRQRGAAATVTLTRVANPLDYGVVQMNPEGRITGFLEKPGWGEVMSDLVNTGIYVLEPEVLDRIESGVVWDFSQNLFQGMIAEGLPLYGHVAEGYWTDIGRIEEYVQASNALLDGAVHLEPIGTLTGYPNVWAGGEIEIAPDARLEGPIYLGAGVKIKGGVVVKGPAIIRDNVVVDTRAHIERAIIWRNSYVGERVEIRGAIIGLQCSLKARAMIFEGAVLSDNTLVGENAVIQPGVKVWPDKQIEPGATLTNSLVWGATGRRSLFSQYGVTGMVNVELTPDFCTRLGTAYGAILHKGEHVIVNREAHNTPRVLKRAILSGLPAAGIHVLDSGSQPIPVARFYTAQSKAAGGIHVRLSPYDQRVVDIKFFGRNGLDLSQRDQRSIENVYFREDYRRVYLDEIGQIDYPTDVAARYKERFRHCLDLRQWPLRENYDHVVIDYANAAATTMLPDLLTELKCDVLSVNTLMDQSLLFRSRAEFEAGMARLGTITRALDANFGVRLDVGGERLFFCNDEGTTINEMDAMVIVAQLVLSAWPGVTIAVPLTAPRVIEQLAAEKGGHVRRLRPGTGAMMEAAEGGDVMFVADDAGGFIFASFTPFLDGMFAVAKIMELTATVGKTLSALWRDRPTYHLAHHSLACRWEDKGRVIRQLHEQFHGIEQEGAEGITIPQAEGEWALILPHPSDPSFLIYAEAQSEGAAREIVQKYVTLVSSLL